MFGRNKKKKEKRQALEVRARSKSARAFRLKLALNALAISAGLVLVLLTVWKGGEVLLERYVYTNPSFAVADLRIKTDGIIPAEQIRRWAGVKRGDNLLSLNLPRIKRSLELVPLIESASVERHLPRRLVITVIERKPIARVLVFQRSAGGGLEPSSFYLDRQGMVIPPYARNLNPRAFDEAIRWLPNLAGIEGAQLRPGHKVAQREVLRALEWVAEFRESGMAGRVDVTTVEISDSGTLEIATAQGNHVTFSTRPFAGQFARWRTVHEYALRNSKRIARLDLAVTNYVPAKLIDLTNAPPSALHQPRGESPNRKKHV